MQRSLKLLLLFSIWGVLLSWYFRVFPFLDEPGMTGGFGVIHDWPRFHLVETGTRSNIPSGITETSVKMSMPEDLTTYLLGMYTLISGNVKLSPGLKLMHTLPNLLYFIPAMLGVSFYRQANNGRESTRHLILLFVLGLFISPVFINYTDIAINQAGYGICVYAIALYIVFRTSKFGVDSRWVLLFSIISGVIVSLYHTQGLLAIFILPGYYLIYFTLSLYTNVQKNIDMYKRPSRIFGLLAISISIMVTVGIYYSTVVSEIVLNLINIFIMAPESSTSYKLAKQSGLFSLNNSGFLEFIGVISKILIRLSYIIIISYFIYGIFKKRFQFEQIEELFLAILLILYPIVLVMFYSYGGIGVGVQRTAAAGAPVILYILAYILSEERTKGQNQIFRAIVIILILLTVISQVPILQEPPRYSEEEVAAIEFTGQSVETSQIVFSDSRMGSPLLYYDHRGVVYIRVIRADWEQRLRQIFFVGSSETARQAIVHTANEQTVAKVDQSRIETHYILTSKQVNKTGVSLESLTYQERPHANFYITFDSNYNRVYHSGGGLLYDNQ